MPKPVDMTVDKNGRKLTPGQLAYRIKQYAAKEARQKKSRRERNTTERNSDWVGNPTPEDVPPWSTE